MSNHHTRIIVFAIIFLSMAFAFLNGNEAMKEDNGSESENDDNPESTLDSDQSDDVFSASLDIARMLNSQNFVASIVHQFVRSEIHRLNSLSQYERFKTNHIIENSYHFSLK